MIGEDGLDGHTDEDDETRKTSSDGEVFDDSIFGHIVAEGSRNGRYKTFLSCCPRSQLVTVSYSDNGSMGSKLHFT